MVVCKLTPDEFWKCRIKDFFLMLEGYQEISQNQFRQTAELIRLQTTKLVNMSGRSLKDGENLTPVEVWRFEWDEPSVSELVEGLTDEQIAEHNARLAVML